MSGVGDLIAGAVVSELLKVVIEEAKMVLSFKSVYMELASTMEKMLPIIIEIEMLQRAEEIKDLEDIINEARVLVQKCSQVKRWNIPSKIKYTRKIKEINKKMLKFCQIQLQLIMLRNQRLIMHQAGIHYYSAIPSPVPPPRPSESLPVDKLKAIKSHLESINKELEVLSVSPPVYRDLCSVPKLDKVLVGLDLPLLEVKKKLLDDDSVVSFVVSAPPGCGKTTLVTKLCHDDDIKEKFENIFFCDVSTVPTFRTIVQTLLKHNGYEAPTFENDSQAVDGLRNLLEELKEDGPILLVLDDVWPGAESLLQKFQINIQNFKILVTSRCDFRNCGPTYHLKPLGDEDAKSLLIERASLILHNKTTYEYENLLQKTLKRCYGFPFLIEVIGVRLIRNALYREESWSEEETILDNPQPSVLQCLQPILNVLEPHLKDCFLDIGSFLTQGKIRVSSIIDIWIELYGKGSKSSYLYVEYLNDLALNNLLKIVPLGKNEHENSCDSFSLYKEKAFCDNLLVCTFTWRNEDEDGLYNRFLLTQHSILKDLAFCQSKSEEHQERKRLNLEIRDDKFPDWCLDLMQPLSARTLSISTDDLFTSTWVEMDCPNVEVLVLSLSSSSYALPNFIAIMKKLKVVIIINCGLGPVKLTNLSCLSSLPDLKRIRFEKISITWLDIFLSQLGSLEKLSLFMCSFGEVSYNIQGTAISEALPSLQEIDINCCYDLEELPDWVYEIVTLKKLSIRNCGNLSVLPKAIGNLSNLEVLRLGSCINLYELPESTERLSDLRFLDISHCLALKKLPLEIGKLQKLEKISMRMCSVCELPDSVRNLENLKVECDEETGQLWERLKQEMRNLTIMKGI